ncbi:2-hydroxy-3-oxopropionate reductase [Methylopila capsulata]|uniref:2-hydroxy-3-oxopropionate reductase n=1 Tax=Methylopila capsulata TaxID=61654 RepID=A0A9W6IWB0_9HYPH|nr:NAD(P)-dependent oxidoreductase [Methylopila capsulata]MBM7852993.1 2-hydroxy-3-oxopropionate reductase [Methylopila capsulata]GLK57796.1 dehydrogenase [Methylopila capsulata]
MTSVPTIAFLGTGLMGAPMARRLLGAGFAVTAWNRTRAKAEALAADGATVAATAADAASKADVVVTMLENGAIVGEVLFGPDGAAAALKPGGVVIDMSSIPPAVAREHALKLAEMGLRHIDAPVSGGTRGAAEGTLAIMVGGAAETFDAIKPVFAPMGRAIRVGPSGAGQLSKLANQVIVAVTIGAVSEALLLASAGGADAGAVREAIRGGFAESRILQEHGLRMVERNFVPGGPVRLQVKDLETALDAAAEAGVTLPLLQDVRDRFVELRDGLGGSNYDHSALLLQLEALSGKRVGTGPDRLPG